MDIPASDHYVVVLWDYDGAPDAIEYRTEDGLDDKACERSIAPYYVWKKWIIRDSKEARNTLHRELDWEGGYLQPCIAVGAALFTREGMQIEGYGMTFPMPETKFPSC